MEHDKPLVIISCSSMKTWDKHPSVGPTAARDAYKSPVFAISKEYAEKFGETWLVLSAKYGFVEPDFLIPENYNVRMGDPGSISPSELRAQIKDKGLARFKKIDVLGSLDYCHAARAAFEGTDSEVRHVNGNVGYPPSFIKLIRGLIANNDPSPKAGRASCCRGADRSGPLARNPEFSKPQNVARVVPALLEYGRTIDPADLFPASEPLAAKLITGDPYAFLLAACLDRGTKVEIIWNIPYDIKSNLGKLDPFEIGGLSISDLEELVTMLPRKPRYINDAPRTIRDLTSIVCHDCDGDARSIWRGKSSKAVRSTLFRIHGVGPGIANMIPLLIEKAFGEEFADLDHAAMNIKPDRHTVRVLFRLGLSESMTTEAALNAAKAGNPSFPGKLDPPLWLIGRKWCFPVNPRCGNCPMDAVCPKIGV
jgi:endonuclease III